MRAAQAFLQNDFDSPTAAAKAFCCQRELVNYYIRKLAGFGYVRSESRASAASTASGISGAGPSSGRSEQEAGYSEAYACAGSLVARHGRRKAALIATETVGIPISASSAFRAHLAGGVKPRRRGGQQIIPMEIEDKIEDLCVVLREMKLPLFRNMVMKYVNALVAGTAIADKLKHKEVRRHWYYNWLRRCSRLTTGNLTSLEMSRAQ